MGRRRRRERRRREGGLGRPEAGAHQQCSRVSLRMVGCAPSLAVLSFLLPLINISQASLMTRIGLRLGGKHNSVSHQVSKIALKKNKNFPPRWGLTAAECRGLFGSRERRSRRSGGRR